MVTVSYPGVYIEEVPSGVRTITGVATSITAFVGYTRRGATDSAVKVFTFGDFEREFGGLNPDSHVSYAVYQFFQNGGSEAWVVRVAAGAQRAGITLCNDLAGSTAVLSVEALTQGEWGNSLWLDLDYDTTNPASLFNLTVTEYREVSGRRQVSRTEVHRNLSMNSYHSSYAVDVVRANSSLIRLHRLYDPLLLETGDVRGSSLSGDLGSLVWATLDDDHRRLAVTVNGDGPYEFDLFDAGGGIANLNDLAAGIQAQVSSLSGSPAFRDFSCAVDGSRLRATSGQPGERSAVHFSDARIRNAARLLRLGIANGGREETAAATIRPAQTGTVAGLDLTALDFNAVPDDHNDTVTIAIGGTTVATVNVALWTAANKPTNPQTLRACVQAAFRSIARAELNGASAGLVENRLRIVAGGSNPNTRLQLTSTLLGFDAAAENITRYAPGVGMTVGAQTAPVPGRDGEPPAIGDLRGSRAGKSGFYALEDVDLFNILTFPNISEVALLTDALDYCEERRAFLLIDLPAEIDNLPEATGWLEANATLRHKNAAAYFPRIEAPDPLQNSRLRPFPSCGAVAGLYARTDSERGVWKAPAGIDAVVRGVTRLAYTLSDQENGVINPLGLNAIRSFPVYGSVVWGARTLQGADVQASEWKYIPVRRLALYIEESLYRGTRWVVFEPNDEPLWAQIRLNVGAFMTGLFRRGAFQGSTPDKAFFVKCDGETTTQADRNLGIVNIEVGFAPLKPAEFVIIRIQQMAGELG